MKKHLQKAFTLVELIVVIVILAILATIAFLSFQNYSGQARDSNRMADINNFSKSLELYQIKTGSYPSPDNSFTITYSGGSVWYQGTIGDNLVRKVGTISKKIVDPLTNNEYTYSLLSYGNSYQIKANYEGDSLSFFSINQVQASIGNPGIAYIKGNYQGVVAKTASGSAICILALPSIITNTGSSGNSYEILNNALSGTLLYNGQSNTNGINYNPNKAVFCGASLPTNDTNSGLTNIASGVINAYSGTIVTTLNPAIQTIVNTPVSNLGTIGANIITGQLGGSASASTTSNTITQPVQSFTMCTATGQTYTGVTTYSSCDTPDKVVCTGVGVGQVWSMCNVGATTTVGRNTIPAQSPGNGTATLPTNRVQSVQGNYYQWGRNTDVTSTISSAGPVASETNTNFYTNPSANYDWLQTPNPNLWGGGTTTSTAGYYSDQSTANQVLMQGPCASGYHLPTIKEWCDLVTSINPAVTCTFAWQNDTSIMTTLKLPLAGFRYGSNATYYDQSTGGYYWASSPYSTCGYGLYVNSSQVYPLNYGYRAHGFAVRCLKN